jgi:hypothetical protein
MVCGSEVAQHPAAVVTLEAEVHLHPAVVGRTRVAPRSFPCAAHVIKTSKRRPGRVGITVVDAERLSDPPMRDLPELTPCAAKADTEQQESNNEPSHEVAGSR